MVVGDFNDIASPTEKKGATQVSMRKRNTFRERINMCKLININMIRPKFRWHGPTYHGGQRIHDKLNRALCNDD